MTPSQQRTEALHKLVEQRTRNHIYRLRRRRDFLKSRLEAPVGENAFPPNGHVEAERIALDWAIEFIESALLIGMGDEIEQVMGMDPKPDPAAWQRRGEIVPHPCPSGLAASPSCEGVGVEGDAAVVVDGQPLQQTK
jgi:hypothetical protein